MRVKWLLLSVLAGAILTAFSGGRALALSGSEFQAGRIIDDQVFFDPNAMNVGQIQSFLSTLVPTCDSNGDNYFVGTYKGVTYSNGQKRRRDLDPAFPAPYTCVTQFYENSSTHQSNVFGNPYGGGGTSGPGVLPSGPACDMNRADAGFGTGVCSAAQIIYAAQVKYSVSAKVILATMQKEALGALLTDDWPWYDQYRSPMGYGCPDTAPCNTAYYGFYNQVINAASQFRNYANNPQNFSWIGIGNNNIKYHPNTACGTKLVNIVNQATVDLYLYTPYTPNAAALNNLYGTGDACSSYGNRNFWRIYNDWFGSTFTPAYASQYVSESTGAVGFLPGQSASVSITYKNTGANTWYDNVTAAANSASPVHLSTSHPLNRHSGFGSTWGGNQDRPTGTFSAVLQSNGTPYGSNPHVVAPGESATFTFTLTANSAVAPGTYQEFFQPIVEGGASMNDPWTFINVTEQQVAYSSAYAGQSAYPTLKQGQSASVWLKYKNTGNMTWYDDSSASGAGANPVHLATSHALNRASGFASLGGGGWCGNPNKNRAACSFAAVYEADGTAPAGDQHVAQPGQIVKFNFTAATQLTSPAAGTYREYFQPILEGVGPMNDPGTFLDVTVTPATFSNAYVGQSAYPTLQQGQSGNVWLKYKNTGNMTWYDDSTAGAASMPPVHLATSRQINRSSGFGLSWGGDRNRTNTLFSKVYESDGVTLASNQHAAAPNQIVEFDFAMTAPLGSPSPGTYREYFQPLAEGLTSMNDPGTFLDVTVTPATFSNAFFSQSAFPTIARGSSASVYLMYKNTGNAPWYDSTSVPLGNNPVVLATSHPINRASSLANLAGGGWCGNTYQNRAACVFGAVYEADGSTLAANQHLAQPGQIVKFNFSFAAATSATVGTYVEYFQPIVEGYTTMNDPWTYLKVTVN
jgi:hypothetical protein